MSSFLDLPLGGEIVSRIHSRAAELLNSLGSKPPKPRNRETAVGNENATTGFEKTLRHLAKTKNEAAVNVLLTALDSAHREVSEGALGALLDRRGDAGGDEILARLDTMDASWKEIIRQRPGRLTGTLRNAVVGHDEQQCEKACRAIVEFRDYDLMPTLINASEDPASPQADRMAQAVLELAEELYDELAQPRDYQQRRDPHRVRQFISTALEQSVRHFEKHERTEILEAFLILANRDNVVLKRIIEDPFNKAYLAMVEVLTSSPRRGVMRLVLSFLDDPQAPGSTMTVLSHRRDLTFLGHLLKKIGFEPTNIAKNNLRRIESIPWMTENREILSDLDDAEQHAAVQLATCCHLPQDDALGIMEYLLDHGTTGGRCAAAAALANFSGVEANQLALAALEDSEPRVQAAVIPNLRQRGIPGAMNRLLALVDSPLELVRTAAREQLVEFRFERFVDAFDDLAEEVRTTTGRLVQKVDPRAAALLASEMVKQSRTRRLRAIAMTGAMGMVARMEKHLRELLKDEESLVRTEAARILSGCDGETVVDALRACLADRSAKVQQAAEESLRQIGSRAANEIEASDEIAEEEPAS